MPTDVFFYLPDRTALGGRNPLDLDPDIDWRVFGTGVYVWILQTFLRLRAAGDPVSLIETPPRSGIVVAHADHMTKLLVEATDSADVTFVVARSDRAAQPMADFGIVQNARSADSYHFFIPSWLQPGLIERRHDRGSRVENVAYVGSIKELDADLANAWWVDTLRDRGMRWDPRTITFSGNDQLYSNLRWNDYLETDVVVALRPPAAWNVRSKPAAKLTNAWAAGVPAIVSPESAYQEVRRSPLDYLEARSAADVLAGLDRLRASPALYADMVRNGLERAREFRPERLVERWRHVLWGEIPRLMDQPLYRLTARSRRCRVLLRRLKLV